MSYPTETIMIYEPTIILKSENVKIANSARIDSFCKIEGGDGVRIGEHVHISSFCHLNAGGATLVIEDHASLSSSCCVASATADWNYLHSSPAQQEPIVKRIYQTRILRYAILFMHCTVVPGVTVGIGAICLPGSVIENNVPDWAIVKGNPARVVGRRKLNEADYNFVLSELSRIPGQILFPDRTTPSDIAGEEYLPLHGFGIW